HFSFSLVLFLEDAFRRGFFENSFLRNLPAAPVIKFVVIANDRRAALSVCPPHAALPIRPDISDEEYESVDETEFRGEREIGLELFACALRNEAQPARERLSADFPGKTPEQYLADGPRTVVRFAPHGKAERAAGFLVLLEFFNGAD